MPGPTAPQVRRDAFGTLDMSPYFGPGWQPGDEYLNLNIWTPEDSGSPRPVMVFVHGGGFVAGSNRAPLYDGARFARDGAVLVSVNYRLGIPGFLHVSDAPDNRGLLDVLAALEWIQANIAGFGGDPDRVTVFGQSAGAILVAGLLAEFSQTGIFRRAVMQSGSGTAAFLPEQASIVTDAVAQALGVEPTAAALAPVPDSRLVEAVAQLTNLDLRVGEHLHPLGGITPFSLVSERQPTDRIAAGGADGIDLLVGSNLDEGNLYLAPLGLMSGVSDDDLRTTTARLYPDPDSVLACYRERRPDASPAVLRAAVLGDALFRDGTRRTAWAHSSTTVASTFVYEFTWRSDALDGLLGACHTLELPFVFDRLDLPSLRGPSALLGSAVPPADLASRLHAAWLCFATSGQPGWPPYQVDRPHIEWIDA